MYYKINPQIALRSWRLVPNAYYLRGRRDAAKLTRDEYETLSACDGMTDLPESETLAALVRRGFALPCEKGDEPSAWSRPRVCDNRYFPAVNWAITGKCNFNCRHCFMAADNARLMREFSWPECLKLIAELDECGVQTFTLTGGEPMLHPHFTDIIREICRRGMTIAEINTNGSFISDKLLADLKKAGADPLIKISFDCIGHHDWMRGVRGAEKIALNAVDICKKNGFRVRIQTCVHRGNLDTLPETAKFMAEKGVEEMRIIRTTEAPRWAENGGELTLEIEEYYGEMLKFAEDYLSTGLPMEIDLWQFLQVFPERRAYHYRPVEGGCHSYRDSIPVCRGNRGMIAINSDGAVVPCNQMSGYFEKYGIDVGNVHRGGLKKLLQEGRYLDTVTCTVGELLAANEKCAACEHKKLCLGGCRAIALALTGDYLASDPAKCLYFGRGWRQKTDEMFARLAAQGIGYENIDDV